MYFKNEDDDPASPFFKIFDLKRDFPSEWHKFLHPNNPEDRNVLDMKLSSNHFSYRDQMHHGLKVKSITLLARSGIIGEHNFTLNFSSAETSPLPTTPKYGDLYFVEIAINDLEINLAEEINWQLRNTSDDLFEENKIEEIFLVLNYSWAS